MEAAAYIRAMNKLSDAIGKSNPSTTEDSHSEPENAELKRFTEYVYLQMSSLPPEKWLDCEIEIM